MTELYNVVVLRKNLAAQIQLNYSDKMRATEAMRRLVDLREHNKDSWTVEQVAFEDSFGSRISFYPPEIGMVFMQDVARSLEMQGEQALIQARAQAKAQRAAKADPTLRLGNMIDTASMPHA